MRVNDRGTSVSLCMIVRNEGHQLADCLEPVAALFDEIIIVDTGSTDDTREVARRFTPHVFDFPWCDDFSAARNESLRHATGEWIFWLDADDRLSPENVEKLRAVLAELDGQPAVYMLETLCSTRTTNELERLLTHPRLFRRHPALAWRRRIHEQLHPWPAALGYEVRFRDVCIEHVGYHDKCLLLRKHNRNARLLRMEYAINPDDPDTLLELGDSYMRHGSRSQSRRCFERFLATAPRYRVEQHRVFVSLTELAMQEGNFREAVDITARGMLLFPGDDHLPYLQSEALYEMGDYVAARTVLERIIAGPEPIRGMAFGKPADIKQRLAPLALGEVLRMQREYFAAECVLLRLTEQLPADPVPWQFLGRLYVDTGARTKFEQIIQHLVACERLSPHGRSGLFAAMLQVSWELVRGSVPAAEQMLSGIIAEAPDMPLPRQLLAQCLERRGAPATELLKAYSDVLRVQPGHPHAAAMLRQLEKQPQQPPAKQASSTNASVFYVASTPLLAATT